MSELFDRFGIRRVINASGTETVHGASRASERVVQAVASVLPHWIEMSELQRAASGNQLLYHSIENLIGRFRDVRERINRSLKARPTRDPAEHRIILEAIRSRDPKAAEIAMANHLKSFRQKASVAPQGS